MCVAQGQVSKMVRLLLLLLDRFLRHHEPDAVLLKVFERKKVWLQAHCSGCVTRAVAATGGSGSSPAPFLS